ncbi:hypothetical protein B9Z19DRAFT_1066767 [Tuber borchii]|uniref:Uncharacterized protein n=1 Tax=Tuber borchii TaxID=42251 RepID=A0A2T6ZL77_TUBBO|nr:hypothetical protein B9Z19DRAFT_1066767 [Tuber borchii]
MSQNPRGRPSKSAEHKKHVKKVADQKRYVQRKVDANSISTHSRSKQYQENQSHISNTEVEVPDVPSAGPISSTTSRISSFTTIRNPARWVSEDLEEGVSEKEFENQGSEDTIIHNDFQSVRWPKVVGLEQILQDMEIVEEPTFLNIQETRAGSEETVEIPHQDNLIQLEENDKEDQELERRRVSAWPKVLGLEQRMQNMDISLEDCFQNSTSTRYLDTEGICMVQEDSENENNHMENNSSRKGKNVLRISHISDLGHSKLLDLMIDKDIEFQSAEDSGAWIQRIIIDLLEANSSNSSDLISNTISSSLQSPIILFPDSELGTSPSPSHTIPSQPTINSVIFNKFDIIEIFSDSDSDKSSPSLNLKDTTNYLIQQYSYNFACSSHTSSSRSTSTISPSWSIARMTQWLNYHLPNDFPKPEVLGYGGRVSSHQWSSLLCGISSESQTPPTLELPIPHLSIATTTTYDIDSFIAKVKCLSVASKGVRVQFTTSSQKNISSDVHLFSKIEERLASEKHLPLSFASASMNTFARGRELGIQNREVYSAKRQELHYFLSGRYLKPIWQDMIKFSESTGYNHFEGMFLLVDAKDLKLQLKSSSISGSWELFKNILDGDLNFKCLDENFQFLDLGQEISS